MGKTQLAVEFAHRYGPYFAGGVFWLSFARPESVETEIAACGLGMGKMPDRYAELDLPAQVLLVQRAWEWPIPRLLLFDNCEDEALLQRYPLPSGGCRILLTSRRQDWDIALGVQELALETLPRAQSIKLLRKFRPDLPAHNGVLGEIADELGDLPLALHLAGSYLKARRRAVTPENYLDQLHRPDLFDHISFRWESLPPTDHDPHVARFALFS